MFIVEEKLLSQYYLDPFKVVGTEGMWGVLYYLTLLPIMQSIKCSGDQGLEKLCNFGYLENSSYAFKQMSENGVIIALAFMMAASIAIFNVCGIMTTKYASAAQRSTIDTSRTVIIWIMSAFVLNLETFEWQAIIGFVMLTFGTLLYNEIIVLPFLGFDQNTKEAKAAREGKSGGDGGEDYMNLSPGKGHQTDARNKRNLKNNQNAHYNNLGE